MIMLKMTPERTKLLETDDHILVLGGPGSGKTTIALLKAEKEIRSGILKPRQQILFLSFARATVARIAQLAGKLASNTDQKNLKIDTYHGFSWGLLKSHGYLLNANQSIRLLPPPEAASRLAEIKNENDRSKEKNRLFDEEGLLHFDLFAKKASELLSRSNSLARIISDAYPIIILDEFQDTNYDEWLMIQELGKRSRLISLADPEQRIYDFRGADPKRISDFMTLFSPKSFDFGIENNRSSGTDITVFGNDLLVGNNKTKTYADVTSIYYPTRKGNAINIDLKCVVLNIRARLLEAGDANWSLAILVPTKKLMIEVSEYLGTEQKFNSGKNLPAITHEVALETSGPSLSAILIAELLEGGDSITSIKQRLVSNLCSHIRGRNGGSTTSQIQLELASALNGYIASDIIKGSKRKVIVNECQRIASDRFKLNYTGDPSEDWLTICCFLSNSTSDVIKKVAEDAKYLRLLHKGAVLRSRLSELWRTNGNYLGAKSLVQDALTQEHFSVSTKVWKGVQVMTIHKSKGKEFDEVIIYEGNYQGRIVRMGSSDEDIARARLMLRVGVTRAIKHATILTPKSDPCIFLH